MKYSVILVLIILAGLSGCHCNKSKKKVNLSGIDVSLQVKRFDKDFFSLSADNLPEAFEKLDTEYQEFASFYVEEILGFGNVRQFSDLTFSKVHEYLQDPYVREVRDSCALLFDDFTVYSNELELALRHFAFYFPAKNIPDIVTFISNFGYSAITYDSIYLCIGLDMHLGGNFKYYPSLYPQYLYEKFSPDYLTANAMKALGTLHFKIEPKDNQLLSQMISNGLSLYFTDLVMPQMEDYKKIGFKPDDIPWCKSNEPQIWQFFIERELLYSTEALKNRVFVNPGPSTSGMPPESPGNVGSWVGWQIVRAYAARYPEVTFEELLEKDPQEIFVGSKYKPERKLF